ncbi:DNA polymerase delta, subunit 4-domain-containing protein [Dioszegia hungarica]|uniref:DNA polymerase delta, subunit 4-domain-containing protein n=1 Tax=Dioszegia hungarica TaxID=4972 RepID=A0AA38LPQ2_9TREE|nr:DNA polymerase delta, subunit 4-domain-containing protein [Dioszegia hungarica]KAI9632352.1 DNA polymerase delta, subunit 4-domain-containing protein [Dioszegia hungarica]
MAPKASTSGGSKTKKAAGLAQPTLAFRSRKPSLPSPSKKKSTAPSRQSSLRQSVSTDDIRRDQAASEGDPVLVTSDEDEAVVIHPESALKAGERRKLDVKSKKWDTALKDARGAMGTKTPIHAGPDTHNNVHHILRVFDMTAKYGPCVGITRLARWERAQKWGLSPPDEVREILTTVEGVEDVTYRETVLHGWV